jgi:hypothetical protein
VKDFKICVQFTEFLQRKFLRIFVVIFRSYYFNERKQENFIFTTLHETGH